MVSMGWGMANGLLAPTSRVVDEAGNTRLSCLPDTQVFPGKSREVGAPSESVEVAKNRALPEYHAKSAMRLTGYTEESLVCVAGRACRANGRPDSEGFHILYC